MIRVEFLLPMKYFDFKFKVDISNITFAIQALEC